MSFRYGALRRAECAALLVWSGWVVGCGVTTEPDPTGCLESAPDGPSPLLHYTFDGGAENLGTLGSSFDGVLSGGGFSVGMRGEAVDLSQTAFAELPGTAEVLAAADAMTIAFWYGEPEGPSPSTPIFDCRSAQDGFHFYRGVSDDSAVVCWGAVNPALGPSDCSPVPLDVGAGQWHHIVFRRAAADAGLEVWVNGQLGAFVVAKERMYWAPPRMTFSSGPRTWGS